MKRWILPLLAVSLYAQQSVRLTDAANNPIAGLNAGLPTITYLGFGAANTVKTVTANLRPSVAGHNVLAIGCSGNFATSNWAAAVTDAALTAAGAAANTYFQIGSNSGTYPQANSTTQVCVPFLAVNVVSSSAFTFTISGSSSANATVSIMVWDVGNTLPNLSSLDGWSPGAGSASTALSTLILVPSRANEVVIAAGCASTGTITLAGNSGLTFDSGSQAIAGGTNILTCFGGSALLGDPVGVTGSFTDSSAAFSEVAVLLRGYPLSDTGPVHLTGGMTNGSNPDKVISQHPAIVTTPPGWTLAQNAASGVTATQSIIGVVGKMRVVTGFCFGINGDGTGAAAQQTFTVSDATRTWFNANVNNPTGVGAIGRNQCVMPVSITVAPGSTLTISFGGNTAHALEELAVYGYDVDIPNVVY